MNIITALLILAIDTSVIYVNPSRGQQMSNSYGEILAQGNKSHTEVREVYINPERGVEMGIAYGEIFNGSNSSAQRKDDDKYWEELERNYQKSKGNYEHK